MRRTASTLSISMVFFLLLGLIPLVLVAMATGGIKGKVVDMTGAAPLDGVLITLLGTSKSAITGSDGEFLIDNIPSGKYAVKAVLKGYESAETSNIEVKADQITEINFKLNKIGKDKREKSSLSLLDGIKKISSVSEEKESPRKDRDGHSIAGAQLGKQDALASSSPYCRNDVSGQAGKKPTYIYPPAHGGMAIVNGQAYDAMFFKNYGSNPFIDVEDDHLSTFAADVDDASYIMARSYLERGNLPPVDAVRTEEFINHFKYDYRNPGSKPFSINVEGGPSRFGRNCQLVRIGIRGKDIKLENRKPANLVFLIDISGSMSRENRLELVKKSLRILVDNLQENDQIGIVAYESSGHVVLTPTSIDDKDRILSAIEWLHPMGATNLEEGLRLAYSMAGREFDRGKINSIILCSDGVANVGTTDPEALLGQIKNNADRGISLTAVGVGMGNYNDILLEKLGDKGNGHYAYVDDIAEAKRIFLRNLTGTLQAIARDVKIQVDFDSSTVRSYRLLGYENRDVADEKFRDNKEDGGEIGAGFQVTALYEIKLQKRIRSSHIATVYIRYKNSESERVNEVNYGIRLCDFNERFQDGSADFRLAAASAQFAEILRQSYWARNSKLADVRNLVSEISEEISTPAVNELLNLVSMAERLQGQTVSDNIDE